MGAAVSGAVGAGEVPSVGVCSSFLPQLVVLINFVTPFRRGTDMIL